MNNLKLTPQEQKKIVKAKIFMAAALELLNSVDKTNQKFTYDGNRNALFNRLEGAQSIVDEIVKELN